MDSAEVLKWIYDYNLVAENKKNARLLYKHIIEGEDLNVASAVEQKSKLRAIENREKKNPEQVVLDYERIIIDKYEFDVHFSVVDLYMRYNLSMQMVNALNDFYVSMVNHKNVPGQILKFCALDGLTDKMSLFFCALTETDLIKINNRVNVGPFVSDVVLKNPNLSMALMRIRSLKSQINSLDLLGKTFVWMMVFFELVKRKFGTERGESSIAKIQTKSQTYLVDIYNYIQNLPVKTISAGMGPFASFASKNCMMDFFYDFRLDFIKIVGSFEDQIHRLSSCVYLCPIMDTNHDMSHVFFIDEERELLFDVVRSTYGHYAVSYGTPDKRSIYIELVSSEVDEEGRCLKGIASIIEDFLPDKKCLEKMEEQVSYLEFSYSFDGSKLILFDDDGGEIVNLDRVDKKKTNHPLFALYNKEFDNKCFYINSLVEEWGYADISMDKYYYTFTFYRGNETLKYRISADADPRLRFIRFDYLAYLYQPEDGDLFLMVEAIGFIPVSFMERC